MQPLPAAGIYLKMIAYILFYGKGAENPATEFSFLSRGFI
jgi:hypothetical protein